MPVLAFDYLSITLERKIASMDELDLKEIEACDVEILVAIDTTSGSISAHVVPKKGYDGAPLLCQARYRRSRTVWAH